MSELKIIRSDLGKSYLLNGKHIKVSELGNYIREGRILKVEDPDGYDMTNETLVRIAFEDVFPPNMRHDHIVIMSEFLDESDLYLVIENGGYDAFVQRRSRNSIFEGLYYFDKMSSLVKDYIKNGKNRIEMCNYLENLIREIQ